LRGRKGKASENKFYEGSYVEQGWGEKFGKKVEKELMFEHGYLSRPAGRGDRRTHVFRREAKEKEGLGENVEERDIVYQPRDTGGGSTGRSLTDSSGIRTTVQEERCHFGSLSERTVSRNRRKEGFLIPFDCMRPHRKM